MAKKKELDKVLLLSVLAILVVGIVMITSIGVPKSIRISAPDLAYPDCSMSTVDCYLILKNHLVRVLIGLAAMFVAFKFPYKIWAKLSPLVYGVGVALLIFVLFGGDSNNTFATSWINLPGVPFVNSLQPSEIAKFGMIIYLSTLFANKISLEKLQDWQEGFLKFALIAGIPILAVILQPDFGSTLVMVTIAVSIYYLAGAPFKHFAVGAAIVMLTFLITFSTQDYIRDRFFAFTSGSSQECIEGDCWQARQANIAIGSGGFWGKGLTRGVQKQYWLPQAADDFIFAASAEELGFVKTVMVVLLYSLIAYRGFQIANHAPNKFAMLMAAGITTWISAQAFINIMVNTALFPITGITLPFMSYGGSSMVTTLAAVGVLLNISQYTKNDTYTLYRGRNRRTRASQYRAQYRY